MSNQNDNLTGMEKGLQKQCGYKKHTINTLIRDNADMLRVSSRTIGKLAGKQAVLDYRAEIGGWEKAFHLTTIGDYTNKRGQTHKAHFNHNGKYLYPISRIPDPHLVLCWTKVSPETIHKWTIRDDDENFKLVPVREE